jgi:hypothetical protein
MMAIVRFAAAMAVACVGCAEAPPPVAPHVLEVPPVVDDASSGEIAACPEGSHPVEDICVADGRPIPKWEPSGAGDPCASYTRPTRGLENCDPTNTGDPDMDHERGAILRTLADTKIDLASCRTPKGPRGRGSVEITYGANGKSTAAHVVGAPYEGTPTGTCVAARFRAVKVPELHRKPSITVTTPFVIE